MLAAGCGAHPTPSSIPVGATGDPESQLIAHLYVAALGFYGSAAHVEVSQDPLDRLDSGDVTVVPGFTGRLLARFDPGAAARADVQVYRTLLAALPEGVAAGDYTTSAEDKPTVAVTQRTADAWGGRDVTALVRHCPDVTAGAVKGTRWPSSIGTCTPRTAREFASDDAMFAALRSGEINAAWTTSAAPDVPSEAVVLSDKTSLVRAENVVPLYRRNVLSESQVLALNEIAGVLDTGSLADMRRQLAEGTEPGLVAGKWLDAHPLGVSN
ncbi:periplasmic glycine betaine/choline-binding (lipo)protein of an ABC-type transport system (osmoprotectant binding protein) [Mycolicibacterium chubuense NBB4]|uniref:Periplasmic glycine betaine/choline-binding (Lipo)protein of an ABC-type transport system (Osmoprotectant binding protein) n=1 Tax=Mycolicibacterium chubuense (strain NBB4) TaxID=710421 RepID=I4BMV1_MYCCN|nr:glycine betaine ABC transporter substrate-binding protein [Mycolicibacterium chubuense]AFM18608.1 periplasmic glycine betaine/choline-binding (lipo)protein of an ABC-type transport system (osmoprotectant binding protein) [Mycolicibacterium chubuense NBB4]